MNLIFLYGPPATGKLTIAKELSKLTGYKVYHNHEVLNSLSTLFPFDDPDLSIVRKKLGKEFRLKIFEEAAIANISFITTFANAGEDYFDFYKKVNETIEKHEGKCLFVQLTAPQEVLLDRVESQERKTHGKLNTKQDLSNMLGKYPQIYDKYPLKEHLTINTHEHKPHDSAALICNYYELTT